MTSLTFGHVDVVELGKFKITGVRSSVALEDFKLAVRFIEFRGRKSSGDGYGQKTGQKSLWEHLKDYECNVGPERTGFVYPCCLLWPRD